MSGAERKGREGEEEEGRREERDGFWGPWDGSLPSGILSWSKSQALIRRGPKTQTLKGPRRTSEKATACHSGPGPTVQRAGMGWGPILLSKAIGLEPDLEVQVSRTLRP